MNALSNLPEHAAAKGAPGSVVSGRGELTVVFARLLVGLIIIICAEVFSGASLRVGLWNPWTLLVTFWLYFAHFFFFTTLAVRTGRTSLSSLYLWGVLFGLYESWITKVIWYGYNGDGKFAMGRIGPYGFSEISMAFLFHPVVAFILPLAVTCLLCPSLRRWFPDLDWFRGNNGRARVIRVYLVLSFASVMAMNSGGPINLAVNLVAAIIVLFVLLRLARPALASPDGCHIVVFGRRGFAALCLYLTLLYGVSYFVIRPNGRPAIGVQLLTLLFYGLAAAGLWLHRRKEPYPTAGNQSAKQELRRITFLFVALLVFALLLAVMGRKHALYAVIALNFVIWTPLGFCLTGLSLAKGVQEYCHARAKPE